MLFPFYSYEKMAESHGEWWRCFTHTFFVLSVSVRLGWNSLPGSNTQADYKNS
jgi:hypothetical protein